MLTLTWRGEDQGVAGVISRIKLVNFLCHSNLSIDLGDNVNFLTGQNGSGKSAILAALCIAFGSKARGTQRFSSWKDFIKIGSKSALVVVELKNEGSDACKPNLYGKTIVIERRITAGSNTIVLKNHRGEKLSSNKQDLCDVIDHFSIDTENPCVIMSQDMSRDFLSAGSEKEKFKFYFKATLLEKVLKLLDMNAKTIQVCCDCLQKDRKSFEVLERDLVKIEEKLLHAEQVDELAEEVCTLRKRLAWAVVYETDKKLEDIQAFVSELKQLILLAEEDIKMQTISVEEAQLKGGVENKESVLHAKRIRKQSLEQHVQEMEENFVRCSHVGNEQREEEANLRKRWEELEAAIASMNNEIHAFGGEKVIYLLQAIERNQSLFTRPPVGPIGAHLALIGGSAWAIAVEVAIGRLMEAFIVNTHEDCLVLRGLARQCVKNVLIDHGGMERQVLVENYAEAARLADSRRTNVNEIFQKDGVKWYTSFLVLACFVILFGYRIFRAGAQTVLPKHRSLRGGRLQNDIGANICQFRGDVSRLTAEIISIEAQKRNAEDEIREIRRDLDSFVTQQRDTQRLLSTKEFCLRDLRSQAEVAARGAMPNIGGLEDNILCVKKLPFPPDSVRDDVEALENSASELRALQDKAVDVCQEDACKALGICSEEELQEIGGVADTRKRLQARYNALTSRSVRESNVSVDELQHQRRKLIKQISSRKRKNSQLEEKVDDIATRHKKRCEKFETSSSLLKKQLQWEFNGHLRRNLFHGRVQVDYESKTLKLEVCVPHDSSSVKDMRSLSGGERSFCTLSFALALHGMTNASFRAMDEFDVFMDDVSRKSSLETLVAFAIEQGSQWIFITPNDINLLRAHPKVKIMELPSPRPVARE
ncbi:structural maintenance of chromosomes protein 6A-like [Selaginella moellendorffii]|uniref:structural maintenance of chromosomes protein 6A-like n=1 Tax=Selaginella moellendorffii TaxID=88036 RepID=UPI000D1C80B6|nr:structural maintenance of chromosomes protein 6A-like [Selaginella moellendorffii]|eukprot:XP_024535853.1 structural maintenance of chromosomes protein 6A-like [Selaginella moellendorffii]